MQNYATQGTALILYEYSCVAPMRRRRWAYRCVLLFACWLLWQTIAAVAQESRRVLVFYELGRSSAAVDVVDREIREVLEKQSAYHIDLYVEYMETNLFEDPVSQQKIREWYLEKYRDQQPDVIVAAGVTPIHFMIDSHEKNFPGVPIVICGSMEDWTNHPKFAPLFTGTHVDFDPAKTLDLALQLQPGTEQVVVVNGASSFDKGMEALFHKSLHRYEDKLRFTYLSGLPMGSLLPLLGQTTAHTVILYGTVYEDGAGARFIPATQSLPLVVGAAKAPVFVLADVLVGQGSVGGNVGSFAAQGRLAGEDVMKILGGAKPQDIPIVAGPNVYLFDWRALQRWGFKERNLPSGSVVLNRRPALIETYGPYVFGGLVLLFAQLLLILELLRQRAKERTIRQHLHESEARLREAQSIAQCGSWVWDVKKSEAHWSDEIYRILGRTLGAVAPANRLLPTGDDAQYSAKMKRVTESRQPYSEEYRVVRPNGDERIVVESGQPRYDSQQKPLFVVGTLLDVTEMRLAEQALRESEERFRTMADGAPIMMWLAGVDKLCTDFNRGWLAFTGRSIEEEVGNGWASGVHPDDLQRCMKVYIDAFDARVPFTMEYRLRRYDGQYHWISDAGSPRFLADGTFAGYIGCCLDIHDRKEMELSRLELARRLLGAQEAERSRIARELHDGIGQEIALLGIQMQRASASAFPESGPQKPAVQQFASKLAAIGVHVSHLSHQLHSSELEYLGLAVAITKLCREFSEQYPIRLTCACRNIPRDLNNDIALTFLRIVQESLHNIAKHSGAKTVQVEVSGTADELSLSVHDDGAGFDVQRSRTAAGLGLVSMRERIYLIGGTFTIDSAAGIGTSVRAHVPLTTTVSAETATV
jgi:PAS domain S-box-containing protein